MGGELSEVVAWLRRQSDLGANRGNEAGKGTTKRSAFGGGSLALAKAADAIESGEYRTNDNTANTRSTAAAPQVDAGELREKVARIIDPEAWRAFDSTLRPFAENRGALASKGEAFWYERTYRRGCRSVEDARRWWLTDADLSTEPTTIALLRESLARADAILKLLPSPIEGRREVIEECAKVADERKRVADQIAKRRHEAGEDIDAPLGVSITAENIAAAIRALSPRSPDLATQAATLESELERVREEMVVLAEAEARGLV